MMLNYHHHQSFKAWKRSPVPTACPSPPSYRRSSDLSSTGLVITRWYSAYYPLFANGFPIFIYKVLFFANWKYFQILSCGLLLYIVLLQGIFVFTVLDYFISAVWILLDHCSSRLKIQNRMITLKQSYQNIN